MKKKTFGSVSTAPIKPRGIIKDFAAEEAASSAPKAVSKPARTTGRPPIDPAQRASEKVTVNLTAHEKAIANAKRGNLGLAAYLRDELRKAGVFDS